MDSSSQTGMLLALGGACAEARRLQDVLEIALPVLQEVSGASTVCAVGGDAPRLLQLSGAPLDEAALPIPTGSGALRQAEVPQSWRDAGVGHVRTVRLPGAVGGLVLAWHTEQAALPGGDALRLALATVEAALTRIDSEERLADLARRVDNAQSLANMGDYDWHIATDTSTWSDQLFRIYGYEPRAFEPSYATFLERIHPDDRERIGAVHRESYATGEPFQMVERIVRPDGEVRFLSSNGEVLLEDGRPVRMRGTCIDITERVHSDRERERIALRFQSLVNSAPDAILVLGEDRRVIEANQRAHELLGGNVRGHWIQEILPGWPTSGTAGVPAAGIDDRELCLDVSTVVVKPVIGGGPDADALVAVYLRDARARIDGEAMAARLGEAQLRRRQALEINDSVVQGLVAASYALEQGDNERTESFLERTLSAARAMMDDLLEPLDGEGLQPGDLVRASAAVIGATSHQEPHDEEHTMQIEGHRVLVVDDAEDLRALLRDRIELVPGLTVVGEAADGVAAVELATALQPDLVMLDLAMPRMDGLEALPLIRAAVPGVRVIVLSGFNQSTLAQKALEAGADHYVVKGGSMRRLLELVDELLEPAS